MKKNIFPIIFLLLLSQLFFSCNKNDSVTEPAVEKETLYIDGRPELISIPANNSLYQPKDNPVYSYNYSSLKYNGNALYNLKYIYPGWGIYTVPDTEFVISKSDSFKIEINNCIKGDEWLIDDGSIIMDNNHKWLNTEVSLLESRKTYNPDSSVSYQFIFKALKEGKGYISFIEQETATSTLGNSRGLLIGYNIQPLSEVWIKIDKIKWIFETQNSFSTVKVKLSGSSNAYRLRIMNYGDGIPVGLEIPVDGQKHFETETYLAFRYGGGIVIKMNAELVLYGAVGLPKLITFKNPADSKFFPVIQNRNDM